MTAALRLVITILVALAAARLAAGDETTYQAGPLTIRVEVDPERVTPVEQIDVTIVVEHEPGWIVDDPLDGVEPGDELGSFDVAEITRAGRERRAEGAIAITWHVVLDPYLPGEGTIPGFEYVARPARGDATPVTLATDPETVIVESLLDGEDFEPGRRRGPLEPPPESTDRTLLLVLAGAGLVGVLATVAALTLTRRRGPHRGLDDAFESLMGRLEAIRGDTSATPTRVAQTRSLVREALALDLGVGSRAMTDDALLDAARADHAVDDDAASRIESFLRDSERLAFASGAGPVDEILDRAAGLVDDARSRSHRRLDDSEDA